MTRHTFRAKLGRPIESTHSDAVREAAARHSSEALLRAQLRAGQHLLALPVAQALAATIGLRANEVRPASGATTLTTGEAA